MFCATFQLDFAIPPGRQTLYSGRIDGSEESAGICLAMEQSEFYTIAQTLIKPNDKG